MNEMKVFSEDPEYDLWRELLQYSYKANIERYFEEHSILKDDSVIDCIIGSFLQAYEYYKASRNVNLQIEPLLLYYGTTNLLYGVCCLFTGKIVEIQNHGMKLDSSTIDKYIAEASVKFENPQNGGVNVFSKILGLNIDLTKSGKWCLIDFIDSIAEIYADYLKCYSKICGKILLLDGYNTPEGMIEKIFINSTNNDQILEVAKDIEGFKQSYLNLQKGKDRTNLEYYILRHKINSKSISKISFSGQPYLQAGHTKNGKLITLPSILNMYISLFFLGSLCRYHPEIWSPFVINDMTGEKLLVEKLLYYARRMIPNIVLNIINDKQVTYVTERYQPKETIVHVGQHQIQELVKKEVYVQNKQNELIHQRNGG